MTVDGHWAAPSLGQMAELAMGVLPREFHDETELTPQARRVYEAGQRLWSTPAAGNFNDSESPESWHARAERLKEQHQNGNGAGTPLAIQAKETALWLTPHGMGNSDADGGYGGTGELGQQAAKSVRSLHGRLSQTTPKDGEPSSTDGPTSPRLCLNPAFVEWLMWGREGIGLTCLGHPATATDPTASEPSATRSARPRPKRPSASCGSAPSANGHESAPRAAPSGGAGEGREA